MEVKKKLLSRKILSIMKLEAENWSVECDLVAHAQIPSRLRNLSQSCFFLQISGHGVSPGNLILGDFPLGRLDIKLGALEAQTLTS